MWFNFFKIVGQWTWKFSQLLEPSLCFSELVMEDNYTHQSEFFMTNSVITMILSSFQINLLIHVIKKQ